MWRVWNVLRRPCLKVFLDFALPTPRLPTPVMRQRVRSTGGQAGFAMLQTPLFQG